MWIPGFTAFQDHLIGPKHRKGKKHRKNNRSPMQSDISAPGEVFHTVRIQVAVQDVPSLVIPVYDVGGTESGVIELYSPLVSWGEMAASWRQETGTNLLPPEGTRLSTIAAEFRDKVLTAVVWVAT